MTNLKQQQLDQIAADIKKRNVCPDLAQTATQLVMGDGSVDADIMFIGEAPGKKEDETGKPFIGAAGKFLDEMLASIGLERSDVYITNIVKYRPPNNRDPKPEEKNQFFPYLLKQLEVIQPKIIVPLGRHSMNVFLPDLRISEVHGKLFRLSFNPVNIEANCGDLDLKIMTKIVAPSVDGQSDQVRSSGNWFVDVLPLYHPAAALYNGSMRQTLMTDFAKITKHNK